MSDENNIQTKAPGKAVREGLSLPFSELLVS